MQSKPYSEWIWDLNRVIPFPFVGLLLGPKIMGNGSGLPSLELIQSTVAGWKIDFSLPAFAGEVWSERSWERYRCWWSGLEGNINWNRVFIAFLGRLGEIPTVLEPSTARESGSGPDQVGGESAGSIPAQDCKIECVGAVQARENCDTQNEF